MRHHKPFIHGVIKKTHKYTQEQRVGQYKVAPSSGSLNLSCAKSCVTFNAACSFLLHYPVVQIRK